MSRQRRQTAQTSDSAPPPPPGGMQEHVDELPRSKARLGVGVAVWGIWIAALVALAGLSANPITLYHHQFNGADLVIIGSVEDMTTGRVTVIETAFGTFPGKELTVIDLGGISGVSVGTSYVMPLRRRSDEFDVMPISKDKRVRIVYPATNEVKSQLTNVLSQISKRVTP